MKGVTAEVVTIETTTAVASTTSKAKTLIDVLLFVSNFRYKVTK